MIQENLNTVDEYLALFPPETRRCLEQIRKLIGQIVPEGVERISYRMPAFILHDQPLLYFAAFKNHIGLYALPSGNAAFKEELAQYKTGKGSIQFPLNKPMPLDLIRRITEFRAKEIIEKEHQIGKTGKDTMKSRRVPK